MIEKRDRQRVPFHCRTTIAARPGGPPVEAWAIDLSLAGVGLGSARLFPVRQLISVTFHLKDAALRPVDERAEGVIVRMQSESDGYIYGIEFSDLLDASRQPQLIRKLDLA